VALTIFGLPATPFDKGVVAAMPKIRTSRTKAPPEGFDEIEPTLLDFAERLKTGNQPPLSLRI